MASSASLVAFVVEQLGRGVSAKKMFGEYGIYRDGVLIALFCDDELFLKPTDAARALLGKLDEAPPYPGAKPAFRVSGAKWDDAELMTQLASVTAAELAKQPKRTKPAKPPAARKKPTRKKRPTA